MFDPSDDIRTRQVSRAVGNALLAASFALGNRVDLSLLEGGYEQRATETN
jgi:hypothetical protein